VLRAQLVLFLTNQVIKQAMSFPYHTHSPKMSSTVSVDENGSVSDTSESDRDSSNC
jgi:hypothetical protein